MNEYLGLYDIPYIEMFCVKILAKDNGDAQNKFNSFLEEVCKQTDINKEFITIIPLFDLDTI